MAIDKEQRVRDLKECLARVEARLKSNPKDPRANDLKAKAQEYRESLEALK